MSIFYEPDSLTKQLADRHNQIHKEIESSLRMLMAQSIELMEVRPLLVNISNTIHAFNAEVDTAQQQEDFSAARLEVLKFTPPSLDTNSSHQVINTMYAREFLLAILDKPAHAQHESPYFVLFNSLLEKARQLTSPKSEASQRILVK